MMTVYDYVASNNPQGAKVLCESFGYTVANPNTMGQNLKTLVNNEGEDALKKIMDLHPDKDVIVEYFGKPKPIEAKQQTNWGFQNKTETAQILESYLNANGRQDSDSKALATNTNTIIFASALVLAVAIIFKNDK